MATDGVLGNGVKVAFSASSPVTWTSVGQVLDIEIPGLEPDEIETTVHGTSKFKRYMPGMIDVSEMTLSLLADLDESSATESAGPAQDSLFEYNQSQTTIWWRVEVPADRTQTEFVAFEFQGWVKNWKPSVPIEDKQTLEVSVRFDGTSYVKYPAGASAIS